MRVRFGGVLLGFLALPPLLHSQQAPDVWTFDAIRFPAVLDVFEAQSVYRWPGNPELGTAVKYITAVDGSVEVDIYVYPVSDPRGSPDSAIAGAEFDRVMDEVREYARTERGSKITIEQETSYALTAADGRAYSGWYAVFTFNQGGAAYRSVAMVFVRDGSYVKVRASHNPTTRDVLDPHLEALAATALAEIVVR